MLPSSSRWSLRLALSLAALGAATVSLGASGTSLLDAARERHRAGDTAEALDLYLEAREVLGREGNEAEAAVCLNNASVILHGRGDYQRSLELAREAVTLRRGLGDDHGAGRSLTNAGRALRELGRFDEAGEALQEALALAGRTADVRDQVVNQVNLGVLAQMEGRYGDALDSIGAGLTLVGGATGEPWAARQRFVLLSNRGALYERIGEFRRALDDYRTVLDLVGDGPESVPYRVNAATVLRNLGDPNRALDELREAERILVAAGGSPAEHANLLSNVGLALHRNLGRLHDAAAALERAYALARASGDPLETVMDGNALGSVYLDQDRIDAAAALFMALLDPSGGAPPMEGAWETHLGMGRALLARGDRAGAGRALRTSVALIEGSRRNLLARFVTRRFLTDRIVAYALLADTLAADGYDEAGLEIAQRARERLLLPRAGDPPTASAANERLERLSAAATLTYVDGRPEAVQAWEEAEAAWTDEAPVRLPGRLAPGEAWIAYLFGGPYARVFWSTAGGVGSRAVPAQDEIGRLAAAWLEALASGDAEEPARGRALYGAALEPAVGALPDDVRVLRIVPDGPLWSVPLDALPVDEGGGRLLQAYEISVAPMLTDPRRPAPEALPFAFFGPPADLPAGLPPLPEAAREAEAVRRAAGGGGEVFVGSGATEAGLRRVLSSGPIGILHVATHATVDAYDPGRTGIVLQPGPGSSRDDDGFLSLAEIAGRRMDVGLAFLSACSGAVGERLPGEGVESLGALLYEAGSGAVVASLWDVQDVPTGAFVEQFYYQVRRGRTVAAAVREAKRALAASGGEMAAPRHWAPWVVIGDGGLRAGSAGPRRPEIVTLVLGAAAVLVLLGGVLWWRSGAGRRHPEPPAFPP